MLRYPHTRLFNNSHRTVVLSGPHIQVLDTLSGRVVHSSANVIQQGESYLINNDPIRCSGMSEDGRYLATAADDKRLKVWELESFTLLNARELPKKPTSIVFCKNTDILVADKFGDVFRYTLNPNATAPANIAGRTSHIYEHQSNGSLILGHASPLTCCMLTGDERFIITADRDEHIRVSWYPQGYVIENFCLGHKKYVSAIHIPVISPEVLISGGGDHELKIWDWMTGHLHQNIDVFSTVEPFIRVTRRTQRRALRIEDDGEGLENVESKEGSAHTEQKEGLVVRRISSFLSESVICVVFSAVGATAIFGFVLAETRNQPHIEHYDFGKPVIDFTVCGDGTILVMLDADFPEESGASHDPPRNLVQAVRWSNDNFIDAGDSKLLYSLNTICALPAAKDDLQALDLYADLSSLPKNISVEQDVQPSEQPESTQDSPKLSPAESSPVSIGLTKRALGRLKHKRAVNQLLRENADLRHRFNPTAKDDLVGDEPESACHD